MAPAGIGGRVEGVHAVAAAVAAGRVRRLTVETARLRRPAVSEVVEAARRSGAEIVEVDSVLDLAHTDAPQGLVAEATPIPTATIDELAAPGAAILVLDHVEDPHNVGAAARSAWAAGMTGMVVAGRRAAPIGEVAFKAAVGGLEHLPVAVVSSVADAISRLGTHRIWTVGLDPAGTETLFDLQLFTEPVAVVVGAEGGGLSRLVAARVDVLVSIPMAAGAESLNASVAAALACFEVARVRRGHATP